jgi:hypothetical protein
MRQISIQRNTVIRPKKKGSTVMSGNRKPLEEKIGSMGKRDGKI